jgi:ferric-dicitrate binding protein FerR (iron transport regulator)
LDVPLNFNGSTREVKLEGEAYFSVESNQNKPFLVYTKNYITKVLGTQFNVMALADESLLEVHVTEGTVAVEKGNLNQSEGVIILKEGDLLQTDEQFSTYIVQNDVSKIAYLKWRQGVIHLDDLPLTRISERLERWYPVKIILESEKLWDKKLTAEFSSGQPLEEILDAISLAINVEYKWDQETVIFY